MAEWRRDKFVVAATPRNDEGRIHGAADHHVDMVMGACHQQCLEECRPAHLVYDAGGRLAPNRSRHDSHPNARTRVSAAYAYYRGR